MGKIVSSWNATGWSVNDIILGEPAINEDGKFVWDFSGLPDGTLNVYGNVITPGTENSNVPLEKFIGTRDRDLPADDTPNKVLEKLPPEVLLRIEASLPVEEEPIQ